LSIFNSTPINSSYVKVQWQDPYVSAALDAKVFGVTPPGIYQGFTVGPGGLSGRDILVTSGVAPGNFGSGLNGSYVSGNFDAASVGYSVAVYQDISGFQTTIQVPPSNPGYHLDATGLEGQTVFIAIGVTYSINVTTVATVQLVNGAQLDANPWLLVVGSCTVPPSPSTPLSSGNFSYFNSLYPRTVPFASTIKGGYVSQLPAQTTVTTTTTLVAPAFFQIVPQTIFADPTSNGSFPIYLPQVASSVAAGLVGLKYFFGNIGFTTKYPVYLFPNDGDTLDGSVGMSIPFYPHDTIIVELTSTQWVARAIRAISSFLVDDITGNILTNASGNVLLA
jgi:hypothetical protein